MAGTHRTQSWLDERARELYWAKVDKLGPLPDATDPLVTAPQTPCWIWTAARAGGGYGRFSSSRIPGVSPAAHRISYMEAGRAIPDGYQVDHLCRNRVCVNPDHLEAVTPRENSLRGDTVGARNASVTHCPKGHAFDDENTWSKDGKRHCRTCNREKSRVRDRRPDVLEHNRQRMRAKRALLKDASA